MAVEVNSTHILFMFVTKAVSQSPMGWLKAWALLNLSDSEASSASEGVRTWERASFEVNTHM